MGKISSDCREYRFCGKHVQCVEQGAIQFSFQVWVMRFFVQYGPVFHDRMGTLRAKKKYFYEFINAGSQA